MTKVTKPQLRMLNLLMERPYRLSELRCASGSHSSGYRPVGILESKGLVHVNHHPTEDSFVRISRAGVALMMGARA